jgi:hypothetical protein
MSTKALAQNVGPVDRVLRLFVGLVLLSFALAGPHAAWGWIGLLPLLTGLVGFCPLYAMVGLNTRSRQTGR